MANKAKELSALVVNRLKLPGNHAVGGVAGLYLYVNESNARSWILRAMVGGKRRHMGLGGFPDVTLAQAREKARQAREVIAQGMDPIAERLANKSALLARQSLEKTFRQAVQSYLEVHGDTWKNSKHRAQWNSTIETYAHPVMGHLLLRDIGQEQILQVLEPIWKSKTETASRVRGRIESVLDWATARKYRAGDNPARWKGHLDKLLAAPSKVNTVKHHRALAVVETESFVTELRKRSGTAARALEFAIFCAARSGEVRGATWSEISIEARLWTVPAARMKAGKAHRVPLSDAALLALGERGEKNGVDLIFPASRGKPLSDMSMTAVMRRMKVDAVPHGFRSTFRDWVGEHTNFPRELAEQALAHVLESKVEAAYRRGDALEKRRAMMNAWAVFCTTARPLS